MSQDFSKKFYTLDDSCTTEPQGTWLRVVSFLSLKVLEAQVVTAYIFLMLFSEPTPQEISSASLLLFFQSGRGTIFKALASEAVRYQDQFCNLLPERQQLKCRLANPTAILAFDKKKKEETQKQEGNLRSQKRSLIWTLSPTPGQPVLQNTIQSNLRVLEGINMPLSVKTRLVYPPGH